MNLARNTHPTGEPLYEPRSFQPDPRNTDATFIALALSGGGTRAAALSYGVLRALHQTELPNGEPRRNLLEEVDLFSSVSGGSFPAAYYALFGDRLFSDFRQRFLLRDIEKALALNVFVPPTAFRHFSPYFDRIDAAADIYDRTIFDHATFRELALKRRKPLVVMNATNMSLGVPFEFSEEQFANIGSDLSSVPIARAVAASSAFPFLLSPITLQNFGNPELPQWVKDDLAGGLQFRSRYLRASAWQEVSDATAHPWIHLLDGGLADNIGAQAIVRSMSVTGGWIQQLLAFRKIRRLLVITVNAGTPPDTAMDKHRPGPGLVDVLFRTSATAMDLSTNASIEQVADRFRDYRAGAIHTWVQLNPSEMPATYPGQAECGAEPLCDVCYFPVPTEKLELYVVNVDLIDLQDADMRKEALTVPTSFKLSEAQVDLMIDSGHQLLNRSPCFQLFLKRAKAGP